MIAPYGRAAAEVFTVFIRKMVRDRVANVRVNCELNPDALRVTGANLRGCSMVFSSCRLPEVKTISVTF